MSDLAFGLAMAVVMALTNGLALAKTRTVMNPVTLISAGFFVPLLFAMMRLSGMQSYSWKADTYLVLAETALFWLMLPAMALLLMRRARAATVASGPDLQTRSWFGTYSRLLAIAYVAGTLLQNYLIGGSPLLLFDPDLAYENHTATIPVLQIIGHAGFVAAALLFVNYFTKRSVLDLLLLPIVVLMPITKLGRIDVMMSVATLVILNARFPVVRITLRRGILAIVAATTMAWALVEVGNQRMNRYGKYSVSYADAISFRGPRGPGELFAVCYGYFSLSFENFDRFVRNNPSYRSYGAMSFSPVFNSTFFVTRLTHGDYPDEGLVVKRRNPVGLMSTVGTALSAFYLDFGAAFAWIPMLVYGGVWMMLFAFRDRSTPLAIVFAGFSSAMMLSCFQHVMAAPFIYQALLLAAVPFRWRLSSSTSSMPFLPIQGPEMVGESS
jgi:hypothetical protein